MRKGMRNQRMRTPCESLSLDNYQRELWYRTYRALTLTRGLQSDWYDGGLLLAIYASPNLNLAREKERLVVSLKELDALRLVEDLSYRHRHRSLGAGLAWSRDSADAFAPIEKRCPVAFAPQAPASRAD